MILMICRARSELVGVLACTFFLVNAFSQGAKVKSPNEPIEENDKDNPGARQQWYMQGRIAPKGKSPAALRLHAQQQKMAMRAQRAALARMRCEKQVAKRHLRTRDAVP